MNETQSIAGRSSRPLASPHLRDMTLDLVLAIVTFFIWNAVVQKAQMEALNEMLGQPKYSFWKWLLLTFITFGIYHVYHEYRMMSDICDVMKDVNRNETLLALALAF